MACRLNIILGDCIKTHVAVLVQRRLDFTFVQSMETAVDVEVLVVSTHRYLVGGSLSSASSSSSERGA